MLVVGDREQENGAVAVRSHADGELGEMGLAEFAERDRDRGRSTRLSLYTDRT